MNATVETHLTRNPTVDTEAITENNPWIVLKFGGTSVARAANWDTIHSVVEERLRDGAKPLLVCSALSGVSNLLTRLVEEVDDAGAVSDHLETLAAKHSKLAAELRIAIPATVTETLEDLGRLCSGARMLGEASPRFRARVLSAGELMSTALGAAYLRSRGLNAVWIDSRDCLSARQPAPGAPPSVHFLSAECASDYDLELDERLRALDADVIVAQGFIASDDNGETVLLGRGGSDTSAAYFAASVGAERLEIWTDVPGIFTTNPRDADSARLLERVGYEEALTMASLGAGVLHPRSIGPVKNAGIPLVLRATPNPDIDGTVVLPDEEVGRTVKVVTTRRNLALFTVSRDARWQEVGVLAELTDRFRAHGLSIDLIASSPAETRVTVDLSAAPEADDVLTRLHAELAEVGEARLDRDMGSVSIVGAGVLPMLHELGPALVNVEPFDVRFMAQGACGSHVSFVVPDGQVDAFAATLHDGMFSGPERSDLGPRWDEVRARRTDATS